MYGRDLYGVVTRVMYVVRLTTILFMIFFLQHQNSCSFVLNQRSWDCWFIKYLGGFIWFSEDSVYISSNIRIQVVTCRIKDLHDIISLSKKRGELTWCSDVGVTYVVRLTTILFIIFSAISEFGLLHAESKISLRLLFSKIKGRHLYGVVTRVTCCQVDDYSVYDIFSNIRI